MAEPLGFAVRPTPAAVLTAAQVRQVFGDGQIRDRDRQEAAIEARKIPARKRADRQDPSGRRFRVWADREAGTVRVGKAEVEPAEIIAALAALAGPLSVLNLDTETETATVRLSAVEKAKLKAAEKRRGLPEWHLIREALRAHGLI